MSMSASCTFTNSTGSVIKITTMGTVNDDASFNAPPVGTVYQPNDQFTISMGNSSVPFAPRGVGFNMGFICQSNFDIGGVYFEDPAVGTPNWSYGNTTAFAYAEAGGNGGNVYTVDLKLA